MRNLLTTSSLALITALGLATAPLSAAPEMNHAHDHGHAPQAVTPITKAIAVMTPTKGNTASGVVTFEKQKDGVKVSGKISGLTPGEHGFHVHQYGDIDSDDGTATGGHYNPLDTEHGGPEMPMHHVGDMGNITADENGVAEFSFVMPKMKLNGPTSIIGRGLIVHGGKDDLTSQPSGAAGPRVGQGVIGVAKD
ncbi:superoxide dismutase family protein [Cerasicoccus fimbriatus]|uniref:superoxide dismutase family protein n=1 Tax=Cerasicoccus fimbriatus TaxID=3014554 RepID=UPI0022B5607F|nr:superoxide dismutase family protein [Cerasicoccus sp. TK19100]